MLVFYHFNVRCRDLTWVLTLRTSLPNLALVQHYFRDSYDFFLLLTLSVATRQRFARIGCYWVMRGGPQCRKPVSRPSTSRGERSLCGRPEIGEGGDETECPLQELKTLHPFIDARKHMVVTMGMDLELAWFNGNDHTPDAVSPRWWPRQQWKLG